MSKTVALIPARWGSARFPGKPLHGIAGKPLVQHVWERCQEAGVFGQVIVATDDLRIAETAFAFGAEVAVTSPEHPSGTDRVAEVARKLKDARLIFNVQGDEPLIDPGLLAQLARKLARDHSADLITAATPLAPAEALDPNSVKVVLDRKGAALYFSRSLIPYARNPAHARYLKHLGVYGYRRKALLNFVRLKPAPLEETERLEQLRALQNGMKIRVVVTETGSVGVDTPEDAGMVEQLILGGRKRSLPVRGGSE